MKAAMTAVTAPMTAMTLQARAGKASTPMEYWTRTIMYTPAGHHGGRMDQGGDGGGAFHGVRKPHVQRELGGFAHRPAEEAQHRDVQQGFTEARGHFHQAEVQRVGQRPEGQDADQEAEVPHAVADEGLFGSVCGGRPWCTSGR